MRNLTEQQTAKVADFKNSRVIMAVVRGEYYNLTGRFLKPNFDLELKLVAVSKHLTVCVFSVNGIYVIVDNFGGHEFLFQKMVRASRLVKEWFADFKTKFEFYSDTSYFGDIENYN